MKKNLRNNTLDKDLSITEEEMFAPSSTRGRNNMGQKRDSFTEPSQRNSGRGRPPTLRTEAPKPLPPPKNEKSPDLKKTKDNEEMTILK